jgi:glucuronosyltransferase
VSIGLYYPKIINQDKTLLLSFLVPMSTYFEKKISDAPFLAIKILWFLGLKTSEHALNCSKVQEFMHRRDLTFDLVISEQFYQESLLMFAHKYKTPIVTIGTLSYSDFMDRTMGMMTPWSYVPHFMLEYSDVMNLGERIFNVVLSTYDMLMRKYQYLPSQNELAQNAFKDLRGE